jgi:hypothetical protein
MCNYCKKLGTLSMRLQEESNKVKIEWTRQRNSFCCRANIFGHNKCFGEWNMVHWLGSIMTPHISKKHFLWLQAHSSEIYVHGQQFYQEAIKNESVFNHESGECEVRGVLHEVLHVPSFVKNLFLVNKPTTQGLKIKIGQEKCSIKNNVGEIFASVVKENRLYILLCHLY